MRVRMSCFHERNNHSSLSNHGSSGNFSLVVEENTNPISTIIHGDKRTLRYQNNGHVWFLLLEFGLGLGSIQADQFWPGRFGRGGGREGIASNQVSCMSPCTNVLLLLFLFLLVLLLLLLRVVAEEWIQRVTLVPCQDSNVAMVVVEQEDNYQEQNALHPFFCCCEDIEKKSYHSDEIGCKQSDWELLAV